jgi:hypothetical protein
MPPTETPPALTGFSVADLARRWRIGEDKVRTFLRKGELVGVNVATNLSGKPQWRITPESVERAERVVPRGPTGAGRRVCRRPARRHLLRRGTVARGLRAE